MRDRLRGMDANLLVVLHVLLEQRNLTRTADRLMMSRPAVSAALRKLREHFDDDLLVRAGRGMERTELAESLVAPVAAAVAAAEALLSPRQEFDPRSSQTQFSVAMSDYAMAILGAAVVQRLLGEEATCSLRVDMLRSRPDELEGQLLRRDLVVGPMSLGLPGEREALFADELVCVVAADNPCLVDGRLSSQDLRELPRAAFTWDAPEAFVLGRELEAIGVSQAGACLQVDRLLALPRVLAGSCTYAFMPSWLARRHAGLGLVVADCPVPRVPVIEAVHWNPRRRDDPGLTWLRHLVVRAGHDVLPQLDEPASPR